VSALTETTLPAQQKPGNTALRVLAFAAVIALLYYGRIFLITLLIAVMLAFLLEPGVRLVMKLRVPRGLASFIVCSIALLCIYLLGLGIYTEISALIDDLPAYSERVNQLVDQAATRVDDVEKNTYELLVPKRYRDQPLAPVPGPRATGANSKRKGKPPDPVPIQPPAIQEVRIHREPTPLWSYAYNYVRSFYNVALMTSFVPFLVYFMLSWRDHLRRSYLYMFDASDRQIAGRSWERVAEVARAYVIGNAILGVLLGVASALFFIIIQLPYAILAGAISGFLSLVPYVGVPLAITPPLIAALPKYSSASVYVIIAVVVALFHLIALNLLYPKLVGARVHLNPLAVTVALMFWGTVWGGIGLLLAIPITAGLKAVCDNTASLNAYGKLLGD
jgi:predicted PurR-regulated permease PerM